MGEAGIQGQELEEKLVVTQMGDSEHNSAMKWSFKKIQNMLPLVHAWLEGEGEQEERAGNSYGLQPDLPTSTY